MDRALAEIFAELAISAPTRSSILQDRTDRPASYCWRSRRVDEACRQRDEVPVSSS
ncbi:hypothetical protein OKW24_005198 [Peribacillus simplex]|nr:hypothetical protein [Peribacillus simplex]